MILINNNNDINKDLSFYIILFNELNSKSKRSLFYIFRVKFLFSFFSNHLSLSKHN